MRGDYLVFGQPFIEEDEIAEVVRSLRAGWLGRGPKVVEFERRAAEYKGVRHAIALSSCTAGLHLSCLVFGIGPGDEIIVPAMTFCATVNAVIHAGATPVLVDVDPQTFNIDAGLVRKAITKRTKALIAVHFAGRPCDMNLLCSLAEEFGLKIIEDCAHAFEAEFHGRKAGAIGECGILSFHSTKNVVTGEGGMLLTNNSEAARRTRVLAAQGISTDAWTRFSNSEPAHYEIVDIGFKYNMTDVQAAIGIHQLARVDAYWRRRLDIWNLYNEAFASLPIRTPVRFDQQSRHALHLYTLLIDEKQSPITRDQLMMGLHQRKIGTGVHYQAIPSHPIYRARFGWKVKDYPVAESIGAHTLSLPLSAKLTDADVADVISAVIDCFYTS